MQPGQLHLFFMPDVSACLSSNSAILLAAQDADLGEHQGLLVRQGTEVMLTHVFAIEPHLHGAIACHA